MLNHKVPFIPDDEELSELYKLHTPDIIERVNVLDSGLHKDPEINEPFSIKENGFQYLKGGTERLAYYDDQHHMVIKKRHIEFPSQAFGRIERVSLHKAHSFFNALQAYGYHVRYAKTEYHIAPSGEEYLIQEYVPNVGYTRFVDAITDKIESILMDTPVMESGLSRDYTDGNIGTDPIKGTPILVDLLNANPTAWW